MQQEMQPNLCHVKHLILGYNKKIEKGKRLALTNLFRNLPSVFKYFFSPIIVG